MSDIRNDPVGSRRLYELVLIVLVLGSHGQPAHFKLHRFPAEIIARAVWLYYRFPLSFHDLDNLLAERDIDVSLQTISERAVKFGLERAPHSSRAAAIRQSKTNATSDVGACDETSGARPK